MLPLENIDHIFSFLLKDYLWEDLDSLERCSLAGPVLAPIAERYLYRSIMVMNGHRPRSTLNRILQYTYLQMKEVLSENPLIANHVRILEIRVYHLHHNLQHSINRIISLLPIFTQLKSLSLSWHVQESFMSKDFIAALDCCMRLPSLTDVTFNNYPIPLHLLSRWKRIKTLAFGHWPFATAGLHSK